MILSIIVFNINLKALPFIRPGLACGVDGESYIFEFEMPQFEEAIDTIRTYSNESYFSFIRPIEHDRFDYLGDDGRPVIPFYSVNLMLPHDVTYYDVTDFYIEDSIVIQLHYDYLPAQTNRFSFEEGISYDEQYYLHGDPNWNRESFRLEESNYQGYNGLSISFFPFRYDPTHRELTIIKRARYKITFDGSDLNSYFDGILPNISIQAFNFYDYIKVAYPIQIIPPINGDNYLIITSENWEETSDLRAFVHHKESLGYRVLLTNINDIGHSPVAIRSYIRNLYITHGLKYVLLVGNVDAIPFSDGIPEDVDEPPTDIFYSCLSKSDMSDQWKDLNPSVFVGRWPIQNEEQLRNVVHKTIESELHLGNYSPTKLGIFSGDERYFYKDCEYIYENIVEDYSQYYSGDLFDGRTLSASGFYVMKNYLEDSHCAPTWMFVYSGHGNSRALTSPYNVRYDSINHIINSGLDFQPFGFGFACLLGNIYATNNFARSWVTSKEGGVTFLGSTTNTYYNPDRYFSRKLFLQLEQKATMTIGEFVGSGKAKYYNADRVVYRRREAKKYVLYGDPSLYLEGLDIHYNLTYPRLPIQTNARVGVNENMDLTNSNIVENARIYSTSGHLIMKGNVNQQLLKSLPTGIYIAVYESGEGQTSRKIIVK